MNKARRNTLIGSIAFALSPTIAFARRKDKPKKQQEQPWPERERQQAQNENEFNKSDKAMARDRIAHIWLPLIDAIDAGKVDAGMLSNSAARETLREHLVGILKALES